MEKEKLIELHRVLCRSLHAEYDEAQRAPVLDLLKTAENLIANGVTVQEWISVKDRLPEDFEFIIVANWDENHTPRVVKRKALMAREYWGIVTGFYAHGQQVTHWMPVPQPPKGE